MSGQFEVVASFREGGTEWKLNTWRNSKDWDHDVKYPYIAQNCFRWCDSRCDRIGGLWRSDMAKRYEQDEMGIKTEEDVTSKDKWSSEPTREMLIFWWFFHFANEIWKYQEITDQDWIHQEVEIEDTIQWGCLTGAKQFPDRPWPKIETERFLVKIKEERRFRAKIELDIGWNNFGKRQSQKDGRLL